MKNLRLSCIICLLLISAISFSQRAHGHGQGRHHNRHAKIVVKRSPFRPHKVVVYHPVWRPTYSCHRRWVFFPARNLYWDNWRNHYVFWNGTAWLSQAALPPTIVNVNLEKEKSVELKEDEDDLDDVYASNEQHKTQYKAE